MGSKVNQKLRFWQRSGSEVEEMGLAAAGATVARAESAPRGGVGTAPQRRITVAEGSEGKVELIQVTRNTPPGYRAHSNADILCIDLHEFGIQETVAWINSAQAAAVAQFDGPACIAVLGDMDQLSVEELSEISRLIEPAGAIFQSWPKGCTSFAEAFDAFGKGVAKNYRWPAFVG